MLACTYFGPDPLSLLPDSPDLVSPYGYPFPLPPALSDTVPCSGFLSVGRDLSATEAAAASQSRARLRLWRSSIDKGFFLFITFRG